MILTNKHRRYLSIYIYIIYSWIIYPLFLLTVVYFYSTVLLFIIISEKNKDFLGCLQCFFDTKEDKKKLIFQNHKRPLFWLMYLRMRGIHNRNQYLYHSFIFSVNLLLHKISKKYLYTYTFAVCLYFFFFFCGEKDTPHEGISINNDEAAYTTIWIYDSLSKYTRHIYALQSSFSHPG